MSDCRAHHSADDRRGAGGESNHECRQAPISDISETLTQCKKKDRLTKELVVDLYRSVMSRYGQR